MSPKCICVMNNMQVCVREKDEIHVGIVVIEWCLC